VYQSGGAVKSAAPVASRSHLETVQYKACGNRYKSTQSTGSQVTSNVCIHTTMKAAPSAGAIDREWVRIALRSIGLCVLAARCYATAGVDCRVGAYLLADGSIVDVAPWDDTLRWLRFDGTTGALHNTAGDVWTSTSGWSDVSDGKSVSFSGCDKGSVEFGGVLGKRIDFDVREATIHSHGTALAGRLVMPLGNGKVPVVVLVHGAEQDSALDFHQLQRLLPAYGVGVFVYDKRGTGRSAGTYTQDFSLLADDAVAAMREARRLAGSRISRIGYHGGSQGGWVVPLAANRAPVDFVIVAFGLAVSVIDEDQQEVEIEMREKGHSPAEIAQALEVARAAEVVAASHFTQGFAELDAMRAKYRSAPWYKDLHGNYTYMLLPYSQAQLQELGGTKLSFTRNTPFSYDPMPALRAATVPQLWILGGEDYQAPSAETRRRIEELIAAGHPFSLAYYPQAEHGMTLFDVNAKGDRISTRYAPGYFKLIRDFAANGQFADAYGDAELTKQNRPR
jgi:uncharacterized protein